VKVVSHLPLYLRLKRWQLREHHCRDLKRKEKVGSSDKLGFECTIIYQILIIDLLSVTML